MSSSVDKLNERLGAELGRNRHGGGLYEWHRADTLVRGRLTGHRRLDPLPGEILCRVEPVYEPIPTMPELGQRWALCLWADAGSESEWSRLFPNGEWPKHGYYTPTNAVLEYGIKPDLSATLIAIGVIRHDRAKTYATLMAEGETILDAIEKHDDQERDGLIGEVLPAFGNMKPGARRGGVSLPSKEFAQNIEGVAFSRK